MDPSIVLLESSTPLSPDAGGKARGLQLIMRTGLRVPPAWVVLPGATEPAVQELADRLRQRGIRFLAVRSSARDEDARDASFAGIHKSALGIDPCDLVEAVREISRSTLSETASAYRRSLGMAAAEGPGAVVVQELIPADVAGVAFGAGEASGTVVIEAVEGLGETGVSGRAVPESHVLRCDGGTWTSARWTPRLQEERLTVGEHGVDRVAIRSDGQQARVLTPDAASRLAEGVVALEALSGYRLDVEWALAGGELYFLQARPQTRPPQETLAPGEVWTRVNVRDTYPDIPSALARSILTVVLDAGIRDHLTSCGTPVDPSVPMVATVLGRPVFNERIHLPGDLLGIPRSAVQVDFGGTSDADDGVGRADPSGLLRHPWVLLRSTITALTGARKASRWLTRTNERWERLSRVDASVMSPMELVGALRETSAQVGRGMVRRAMALAAGVSNAQYMALLLLRDHPSPRSTLTRLLGGEEATVSTRQLDDLVSLAEVLSEEAHPSFTASVEKRHLEPDHWRQHLPASVWRRVEDWLHRFGHRGPFESDIASRRYVEDLRLFARVLFPLVRAVRAGHTARGPDTRRREASAAWQEVEARWGPRHVRRVRARVGRLASLLRLREQLRSETVRLTLPLRGMTLELGHGFVRAGRLADPSEVWHLSLDDLERAVHDPGHHPDVAVSRELGRRLAWRRFEVPNRFKSEDVAGFSIPGGTGDVAETDRLRGNGISPGILEGEVRVLRSPDGREQLPPGSVLVAPATDPGWTPLFARAGAIVVEIGGALSHSGIVAREFGVPCVANVQNVTRLLQDGDVVCVDGSVGLVTVVSRVQPRH